MGKLEKVPCASYAVSVQIVARWENPETGCAVTTELADALDVQLGDQVMCTALACDVSRVLTIRELIKADDLAVYTLQRVLCASVEVRRPTCIERSQRTVTPPPVLVALAPYAGMDATGWQARYVYDAIDNAQRAPGEAAMKGVACWEAAWTGDIVPVVANDLSPRVFGLLDDVLRDGLIHAVSFEAGPYGDFAVGGSAPPALKSEMAAAIYQATNKSIPVALPTAGPFAHTDPRHPANRKAKAGGVVITQPRGSLAQHWQAIAFAVVGVLAPKL